MRQPTSAEFAKSKRYLEDSIAHDPEFALAHDALAELNWYLGYFGLVPPRDAFSAGILHALRALEIDGTRAETHALLGQFHKTVDYDWPEVHREMALARRLDPNSPLVAMRYAVSELMPHGRVEGSSGTKRSRYCLQVAQSRGGRMRSVDDADQELRFP